jgi:hypothetical protein
MTGPLCTIDIYRLPGPTRRRQYQTTWRPRCQLHPGLPRVSTTGCSRGAGETLVDTAIGNHARAGRQSVVPRLDAFTFIEHPPIKEPQSLHLLVPGSGVGHDCATVGVAD